MRLRVHPAIGHQAAILANLPKTTGRTLAEWQAAMTAAGVLASHDVAKAWVKAHGAGELTADLIAKAVLGIDADELDEDRWLAAAPGLVDAQYAGKKAALRSLAERLFTLAETLGDDIAFSPCKTYVPVYRDHVIAIIKPATLTRIDLGLALGAYDGKLPDRLIDTGGAAKGDRITHRIAVSDDSDIDDELKDWLETAYRLDGKTT